MSGLLLEFAILAVIAIATAYSAVSFSIGKVLLPAVNHNSFFGWMVHVVGSYILAYFTLLLLLRLS